MTTNLQEPLGMNVAERLIVWSLQATWLIIQVLLNILTWIFRKIPWVVYLALIPFSLLYAYENKAVEIIVEQALVINDSTPRSERLLALRGTTWSREDINWYIDISSEENGADPKLVHALIKCESNYKQDVRATAMLSYGLEDSWGLSQIHLPSHPTVTRENALDPKFAIDFMTNHVGQGRANMWMCNDLI